MFCERCDKPTVVKKKDRIFNCKTGFVDQDCPQDIPFDVVVEDFSWEECHNCNKAFTNMESLKKLDAKRREAIERIRHTKCSV